MIHIPTYHSSNERITSPKKLTILSNEDERSGSNTPKKQSNDTQKAKQALTANIIGWTLQVGVILSAVIILLGVIRLPFRPGVFPHND